MYDKLLDKCSLSFEPTCMYIYQEHYRFIPATPAVNPVEIPKEPEFVIFASYSHPPNTPMRHSVLKEMVSGDLKTIFWFLEFFFTECASQLTSLMAQFVEYSALVLSWWLKKFSKLIS